MRRSTIAALDTGFRRAFGTIIDSHLTALIAAIALFWLGSGPIRGFAVTLAIGIISTCWYSAQLDNPENKKFVEGMNRDYKVDPGFYAAATYTNGAVLEAALKKVDGRIEDKNALEAALRASDKIPTCRGPVSFDKYGNVVGNIYIRKVEKKGGKLVNTVIKTYPNVSQFWTYDPDEFLKHPVYNREAWPGGKNIEP